MSDHRKGRAWMKWMQCLWPRRKLRSNLLDVWASCIQGCSWIIDSWLRVIPAFGEGNAWNEWNELRPLALRLYQEIEATEEALVYCWCFTLIVIRKSYGFQTDYWAGNTLTIRGSTYCGLLRCQIVKFESITTSSEWSLHPSEISSSNQLGRAFGGPCGDIRLPVQAIKDDYYIRRRFQAQTN